MRGLVARFLAVNERRLRLLEEVTMGRAGTPLADLRFHACEMRCAALEARTDYLERQFAALQRRIADLEASAKH